MKQNEIGMDPKTYKQIIAQTAIYPKTVEDFGLAYGLIGFVDETLELDEKIITILDDYLINMKINPTIVSKPLLKTLTEIKKELGDVMWYSCLICEKAEIDFETFISVLEDVVSAARKTQDFDYESEYEVPSIFAMVKKFYRDGKVLDKYGIIDEMIDAIVKNMSTVHFIYTEFNNAMELTKEERAEFENFFDIRHVLALNYEKLMGRRENNTIHGDGDNR